MPEPPRRAEEAAERKIPNAACDSAIPATECLTWHIKGRAPGAVMSGSGLSCRMLCPNHPDIKPSLVVSVGEHAPLIWHCHVCGREKRLEVRAALIDALDLNPKCLPMTRQERAEVERLIDAVFAGNFAHCTKLVCIRAIHDGVRGPLPRAPGLVRLGERASVSRRAAFRAADELAGLRLDHLYVPETRTASQAPQATSTFRDPTSVPDRHPMPNRHRDECQIGIGDDSQRTLDDKNRRPAA